MNNDINQNAPHPTTYIDPELKQIREDMADVFKKHNYASLNSIKIKEELIKMRGDFAQKTEWGTYVSRALAYKILIKTSAKTSIRGKAYPYYDLNRNENVVDLEQTSMVKKTSKTQSKTTDYEAIIIVAGQKKPQYIKDDTELARILGEHLLRGEINKI